MKLMLTEKQIRVLRYFRDYRNNRGIAPTLDVAAAALGVSKITIHEHLKQLAKKGAIFRDRAKARAVAILHDPDADEAPTLNLPTLPLLGRIAAGRPIEAIEDREDISLAELVPTGDKVYLLKVRGKSMIDDHIDDGDLVVVNERHTADNGEMVIAMLNGTAATVKRFYRERDGRVRLQPANAALSPMYFERTDDIRIEGVVVGVLRRY